MLDDATLLKVYTFVRDAIPFRDGVYRMRSFPVEAVVCVRDGRVWIDLPVLGMPITVDLVRGIPVTGRVGNSIIVPPVLLAPSAVIDDAFQFDDQDDQPADETDDDDQAAAAAD